MGMNQQIKARWLERLRSNTIVQTTDYLGRTDGSRCCLGVLCDLAVEEGVISRDDNGTDENVLMYVGPDFEDEGGWEHPDASDTELPKAVLAWAGIDDPAVPVVHPDHGLLSVAILNDGSEFTRNRERIRPGRHTFAQIADMIEADL